MQPNERAGAGLPPARTPSAPPPPPALPLSRRAFLSHSGLVAAAAAITPAALARLGSAAPAGTAGVPLVVDTLHGLVAFVVPGPDPYSVHQGVSTVEPGGIDAGATLPILFALDTVQVAPPGFATFSELVAFVLNAVAEAVHPNAPGPFASPFARLTFAEKAVVFSVLESDPALAPLGGALPIFVGFTSYSEAGVFDPATRSLVGQPVGWTLSGYTGVSEGRAELEGYFKGPV